MNKFKPHVTFIVLNYNTPHLTNKCIQSIFDNTTYKNFEIIICDNHSPNFRMNQFDKHLNNSKVRLVRTPRNYGFGGGFNYVLKQVSTDYVYLLNSDVCLLNNHLEVILPFYQKNKNVGIVSGQLQLPNDKLVGNFKHYLSIWLLVFGSGLLRNLRPCAYPKVKGYKQKPIKVPVLSGATLFIPYKRFKEIGFFDNDFFLYYEEEDISRRLQKKQLFSYLLPKAKFSHIGGQSTTNNFIAHKESLISLKLLLNKHFSSIEGQLIWWFYILKEIKRCFVKDKKYFSTLIFMLKGAPQKESLKHLQ